MYIRNPSSISKTLKFNSIIGKYIINKGVPVVSIENGKYLFTDTNKLQEVVQSLPFYLKIFK
jgi:hypothetical protein